MIDIIKTLALFLKKYKVTLIILFLILFSAALRVYKLSDTYIFGFDEEYQATYAWSLVKDPHPIWIGVSASFIDYYMGPYFTYFTAILLFFSHGDPLITAYFATLVGVITTIIIFIVGWKFFNFTTGFTSALLHAGLPLFVLYDQKYWNPMFSSLVAIGVFIILNLVKKSKYWWVGFAALVGVVIQTDLTPTPFLLLGLIFFLKGKYWKDIKLLLVGIAVFLLFYWPLIIFDFNHNFSNISFPLRLVNQLQTTEAISFSPMNKAKALFDSFGRVWYLYPGRPNADELNISCTSISTKPEYTFIDKYSERTNPPVALPFLSIGLIIFLVIYSIRKNNYRAKILLYMIIFKVLFFVIYPGGSYEYYILDLLTLLIFVPGILISQTGSKLRIVTTTAVIVVIILGVNTVLNVSDKFSLGTKRNLITETMNKIGNSSFEIDGSGICHNYEGWRYLFKVYGNTPDKSYTDANFAWLYQDEVNQSIKPEYSIVLVESRLPTLANFDEYLKIEKGGYTAYIKRNNQTTK